MMTLTGTVQEIKSFSTKNSPGLEILFSLEKTNERSPQVLIKVVAYSKMATLLKELKCGSKLEIEVEPRNGNKIDQVFFLLTHVNRPT